MGHSCFRIKGRAGFTKESVTVITDPFNPTTVGLPLAKLDANIVTVSHQHNDHSYLDKVKQGYFLIDQPGEYEVSGVSILGYSVDHDNKQGTERGKNNIYVIEMDNCRVCHLGDLGRDLTDQELSELGVIDVLLLPVGGHFTITIKEARELVNRITPTVVIPMHYYQEGMNKAEFGQLQPLSGFIEVCQGLKQETCDKYTVEKARDEDTEPEVIILKRKG